MIVITIIIPHCNNVCALSRLLDSIPISDEIEVLVIDNSVSPVKKDEILSSREFVLLYSNPGSFAGGARNVGIRNAKGEWIVFADADDFFSKGAFDCFYKYIYSSCDIVFFKTLSEQTKSNASRGVKYSSFVSNYLANPCAKNLYRLKIYFSVPWGKMIRKQYIIDNNIIFDEIASGNDINFSIKVALNTDKIEIEDEYVYVVSETPYSVSKRRDSPYVMAQLKARLQANKYIRERNLSQYQYSIMYFFLYCCRYGLRPACKAIKLLFLYKQNPFIGWRNWWGTVKRLTSH